MGHTLAEKIIMKHIGGKDVKPDMRSCVHDTDRKQQ